jgi:hypothetical protein
MFSNDQMQFRPKNGHVLKVINLRRISTEHQDEKSLDDQGLQNRQYIESHYQGKVEYYDIATRGSGEALDRKELTDLTDRIDTANPNCRDAALFASWHHERSNKDTSDRIKRAKRARFQIGESLSNPIAGYIKPRGVKHDSEITKNPEFSIIYEEIFRRLEEGHTFASVSDWLNSQNVPMGPFVKRTRWPGQHLCCGICGRPFTHGAYGATHRMACSGAIHYKCWNVATIDTKMVAHKVAEAIKNEIQQLEAQNTELTLSRQSLRKELDKLLREESNLVEAVKASGGNPILIQSLNDLDKKKKSLQYQLDEIEKKNRSQKIKIPEISELKVLADKAFADINFESEEFWHLMRGLVSDIYAFPYIMAIPPSTPVLRISFKFNLLNLIPGQNTGAADLKLCERSLLIDAFEPPQRIAHLHQVVEMRHRTGQTFDQIGKMIGISGTAAQNAYETHTKLQQLGLTDPYVPLMTPFEGTTKYNRHKHERFRFDPLPGFEVPRFPE